MSRCWRLLHEVKDYRVIFTRVFYPWYQQKIEGGQRRVFERGDGIEVLLQFTEVAAPELQNVSGTCLGRLRARLDLVRLRQGQIDSRLFLIRADDFAMRIDQRLEE